MIIKFEQFLNEMISNPMNPYEIWEKYFKMDELLKYYKENNIKESFQDFVKEVLKDKVISFAGKDYKDYKFYKFVDFIYLKGFDDNSDDDNMGNYNDFYDTYFFVVKKKGLEHRKSFLDEHTIDKGDEIHYQDNQDKKSGHNKDGYIFYYKHDNSLMGVGIDTSRMITIENIKRK